MVNGFFGGGKKWGDLPSPENTVYLSRAVNTNNPVENQERIDVDTLGDMCILSENSDGYLVRTARRYR